MNKLNNPRDPHSDDSWDIDEPAYGEGPTEPFEVTYKVDNIAFTGMVQAFFKDGEKQSSYRVTYPNGEPERIIDYQSGVGFIESGSGRTSHAIAIGECIQERFSG